MTVRCPKIQMQLLKLYEERYPLYTKYGDLRVPNNYPMEISQQELDELMNTILEGYHEILLSSMGLI